MKPHISAKKVAKLLRELSIAEEFERGTAKKYLDNLDFHDLGYWDSDDTILIWAFNWIKTTEGHVFWGRVDDFIGGKDIK